MIKLFLLSFVLFSVPSYSSSVNGFDLAPYGFIKASATYASEGLASFNNINLSAPTNAVAQTRSQDETSRMSFQTQQSRIGLQMKKNEDLSAQLEFDFIDFNKSSPTTQMNPRVRIAAVTYRSGNQTVIIGQDWDLFSPVTSYTFDIVGLYFLAGNTGFMRQQAKYLVTEGQWELGGALGMAGNNPGVTDNDLELGKSPTYALRLTRQIEGGRFGISGIYGRLSYNNTNASPKSTHDAYAGNVFFEKVLGRTSIKSEFYYGQNLANLGALSIGKGTSSTDVKEFGGTLTTSYALLDKHAVFGGIGVAKVDNRSEVSPFVLSTNLITSTGISENFIARIGWEYKITDDFSWISELSRYDTKSKLSDNSYQTNVVYGLESGVLLRF